MKNHQSMLFVFSVLILMMQWAYAQPPLVTYLAGPWFGFRPAYVTFEFFGGERKICESTNQGVVIESGNFVVHCASTLEEFFSGDASGNDLSSNEEIPNVVGNVDTVVTIAFSDGFYRGCKLDTPKVTAENGTFVVHCSSTWEEFQQTWGYDKSGRSVTLEEAGEYGRGTIYHPHSDVRKAKIIVYDTPHSQTTYPGCAELETMTVPQYYRCMTQGSLDPDVTYVLRLIPQASSTGTVNFYGGLFENTHFQYRFAISNMIDRDPDDARCKKDSFNALAVFYLGDAFGYGCNLDDLNYARFQATGPDAVLCDPNSGRVDYNCRIEIITSWP
jgi:hypothetical protein